MKYFHCNREGFKLKPKFLNTKVQNDEVYTRKENVDNSNIITRKRPPIRWGCKAQVRLKKQNDNMYKVYMFVEEYNLSFVDEKDQKFLKAYRELTYTKKQFFYCRFC